MAWTDPCVNIRLPIDAFTVLGVCDKRDNDWSRCIRTRIEHIHDFHAMDDVYHMS